MNLLFSPTLSVPEIVVDLFAGGGGASEGIRQALGRDPDAAVNHNPVALAIHRANHPGTWHWAEDVWSVEPSWITEGRPVGLLWASPDCTHFSKAKGGAPVRDDKVRSLACVITEKWIPYARPRVIAMENVEEFQDWGPLDKDGRVIESARGDTFRMFVRRMRRAGYTVQWRELRACDYGAPTIRKRLFLIARCDGRPIVWPTPTHGDPTSEAVRSGKLLPWRTAAECIDWSIPVPSIFERSRPLADNTLRRIAKGVQRYVLDAARPFIVGCGGRMGQSRPRGADEPYQTVTGKADACVCVPHLDNLTHGGRLEPIAEPLRTITCARRGEKAVVTPILVGAGGPVYAGKPISLDRPMNAILGESHEALVTACIAKNYTGVVGQDPRAPLGTVTTVDHNAVVAASVQRDFGQSVGHPVDAPLATITGGGGGHGRLVAAHMTKLRGTCRDGQAVDQPAPTVTGGGQHQALTLAHLQKYYSTGGQLAAADEPMHTLTAKDRMGLCAVGTGGDHAAEVRDLLRRFLGDVEPVVDIDGERYVVKDIGLRMLQPRELFAAQGFPADYIIDVLNPVTGRPVTKSDQVRACGNSVPPAFAEAIVRANCPELRRVGAEACA